jgi:hypothetical protein
MVFETTVSRGATEQIAPQAVRDARRLREKGRPDTAVELLKRARRLAPDDERIAVALAWAYLEQGNKFWALRTANEFWGNHPGACAARAVAIWIHLQMADLEQADEALSQPGCDRSPAERARFALLRAMVSEQRRERTEATRDADAARTGQVYAEDEPLLERLIDRAYPGRLPVLSGKLDLGAGWTSNGLSGSPVDVTTPQGDRGSNLVVVDARLRAVIPVTRYLRPVITGQLRLFELLSDPARELSYEQPTLRAGWLLGARHPRLLVSYAFDAVRLHGGDRYDQGPVWYSEAHRAEWEWEPSPDVLAFGGLGARWFRDMARTRFEAEQGLASAWLPHPRLRLLGAVSGRWQQARADGHDLVGGTVLAELDWSISPSIDLRWNLSASADWYPRSAGYFAGAEAPPRRDLLERTSLGIWFDLGNRWQLGPIYELSGRTSTAEAYSFVDHRVLTRLVWRFDTDRVSVVGEQGRATMEWSRRSERGKDNDSKIQELLRQDEAVKRGSSCLK